MRRFFLFIAILFLPGGIIILIYNFIRRWKNKIFEFLSEIRSKFLP